MKKDKKVITICASASHYRDVLEIEKSLKKLGFKTKIPQTAKTMLRTNNFKVESYKMWYKNEKDYSKKTKLIAGHFKKILDSNAILVVNMNKNGIKGYIGGNVLMEMTITFQFKKPIFIYNDISDDLQIKEEVYGLRSKFIKGDLNKIKLG